MEAVRTWAFSLCAAAAVGALAELLAPNGGTKRMLKLCVSAFFLCCLFSPALRLLTSAPGAADALLPENALEYSAEDAEEMFERQVVSAFAENIERLAADALKESGISAQEISVRVNIDGDNCISISEIEVTLDGGLRLQELRASSAIEKRTGVRPRLIFAGD